MSARTSTANTSTRRSADQLSEIDPVSPEEKVPDGQANFGFDDPRKEVEIEHPHTVTLDRQEGDPEDSEYPKAYKHVPEPEARKYAAVVPRATVTAESIVAALLEDEVDPTEFVDQHMTGKDFLVKVTYSDMPGHVGYVIGSPGYYGVSFDDMAYENASDMDFKTASKMAQHVMWNESARGAQAEVIQAK
jgi:hypothetical protein